MMKDNKVIELFGHSTKKIQQRSWEQIIAESVCPFTQTKCFKVRKSQPDIAIGTCSVCYSVDKKGVIICPNRLLERQQVFMDCLPLLSLHEPGNEFHVVSEVSIPGGNIDYFLVSVRQGKVKDLVAVEFQTLDTTGTLWPERQRLLSEKGLAVAETEILSQKTFGMNWKMTAKTILVQLHHKIGTLEYLNKHLVLVVQDHLLNYMKREFSCDHLRSPVRLGDSFHIHTYKLEPQTIYSDFRIELESIYSTDSEGIAICLGLQAETKMELGRIIAELEKRVSAKTLLTF